MVISKFGEEGQKSWKTKYLLSNFKLNLLNYHSHMQFSIIHNKLLEISKT